jgi:hypothetical protein
LEIGCKCFCDPCHVPSLDNHASRISNLHPGNMQPITQFRFEVTHLEVHICMLSIVNLLFYDWSMHWTRLWMHVGSGSYIITSIGCSSFVQFASMKMTKMLGWSCFIQLKNQII